MEGFSKNLKGRFRETLCKNIVQGLLHITHEGLNWCARKMASYVILFFISHSHLSTFFTTINSFVHFPQNVARKPRKCVCMHVCLHACQKRHFLLTFYVSTQTIFRAYAQFFTDGQCVCVLKTRDESQFVVVVVGWYPEKVLTHNSNN